MRKGWALQRLENICKLRNGRAYKKPELLGDGRYRVLRVGNFFTNNHWYYSDLELDDTKYCSEGDLLYAWSASFGPRIWEGEKVIYHYHIWRVDFDGHQIDKYFLFYWFLWDAESIKKDQGAGTTMVHVSMKSMNARLINVPPLEEQKRIVAILDEAFAGIDTAIANTEKNLANARELFESYLNSVFTQRGEGWEERKLSDYARSISTGPFGSLLHKSDYVSDGVPLVNPINIQGDKIVPDENKLIDTSTKQRLTSYVLQEGDVVIARRGEIGRCAAIDKEHAGWVCGTGCFFIRPEKELNPKFLANLIRSSNYRQRNYSHPLSFQRSSVGMPPETL
ncbi:MAG: hypothetical protein CVV06_17180 [Gammaproteobacteria bacterium HGW-Gammaproteobacteria-10]|nr:MAG: hypothetical protein CVV06_17180 [Gammaproteobacteria bacterium HGW-Gammaproteobacteria-10]